MMKRRGQGREKLIEAAQLEFEEHGFDGTNSNAIARRAGYAPQTFYRHFDDKRAVFVAVYHRWAADELGDLSAAQTPEAMTDALIRRHRMHRVFRQSLRLLTVTDREVGNARAHARLEQMAAVGERLSNADPTAVLAGILKIERLSDAIADGEFAACGVDEADARTAVLAEVRGLIALRTA
jgi:AcrR family transcriptional regulator